MNSTRTIAAALLAVGGGLMLHTAQAQQQGIQRTDLLQRKLSIPEREVVQVRVDFEPGALAPKHAHPGEEIAHVLQGTLEYQLGDQPPVTLKTGDSLFIPAGTPHSARNIGSGKAAELATYVVKQGQPLVVPAK